jgi:hypothetical protein
MKSTWVRVAEVSRRQLGILYFHATKGLHKRDPNSGPERNSGAKDVRIVREILLDDS